MQSSSIALLMKVSVCLWAEIKGEAEINAKQLDCFADESVNLVEASYCIQWGSWCTYWGWR